MNCQTTVSDILDPVLARLVARANWGAIDTAGPRRAPYMPEDRANVLQRMSLEVGCVESALRGSTIRGRSM